MDPFIGEIRPFATTFMPEDWLECDGTAYPISSPYNVLYAVIGNRYGDNGANTFRVPDLRGYTPYGYGTSPTGGTYVLGRSVGSETYSLTVNNIPYHAHQATFTPIQPNPFQVTVQVATSGTSTKSPVNTFLAPSDSPVTTYALPTTTPTGTLGGTSVSVQPGAATVTISPAGQDPVIPYSAMPSFIVVRFGIAYNGTFPVRP
ncbi:MAG: tail fiber protein [Opitutaceae bacterium]|jgi:microcystin-dependent protein